MLRRLALGLLATAVACSSGGGSAKKTGPPARMTLSSSAFVENTAIPSQFTCDGLNISPPLNWSAPPNGTRSVALLLEDLDRNFLHWVAYDIPATQTSVGSGYVPALAAVNDFGKQGYGGPCPPAGERHRYRFTVLALPTRTQITGTGTPAKPLGARLLQAPLAKGELTGTYQRS